MIPRKAVPRSLMDAVGGLLDDPVYSDVEFVIPGRKGHIKSARTVYAAKRVLKRVDYFDTSQLPHDTSYITLLNYSESFSV